MSKSRGHQSKGTHGSLSKASKVRDLSPVLWEDYTRKTKDMLPFKHKKKHKHPSVSNRRRYRNQILLGKKGNKRR